MLNPPLTRPASGPMVTVEPGVQTTPRRVLHIYLRDATW